MQQILVIEAICYIAILILMGLFKVHRWMSENLIALLVVAPIGLMIMTAGIDANLSSPTPSPFGLIAVSLATIIVTVIGYPLVKWLYRQIFPHK